MIKNISGDYFILQLPDDMPSLTEVRTRALSRNLEEGTEAETTKKQTNKQPVLMDLLPMTYSACFFHKAEDHLPGVLELTVS